MQVQRETYRPAFERPARQDLARQAIPGDGREPRGRSLCVVAGAEALTIRSAPDLFLPNARGVPSRSGRGRKPRAHHAGGLGEPRGGQAPFRLPPVKSPEHLKETSSGSESLTAP
jgi:hypothetical protein